ncbi:hypothetical protein CG747_43240 [Streptomyces sp. CB02959]|uniref:hypothetical protein n=1 Tax=Streptomyces sp. CB02959 TaxID=2020330 RepID=UPI000C270366|nr:hypothetical protein [Streptomyces sp. CB02959]PJN32299.1 hypothetical protein CG747_43240 [Streptomyces sp. CB02959]
MNLATNRSRQLFATSEKQRLQDLRASHNQCINELFPTPRGVVAYAVTADGNDGSKEFSQLRQQAQAHGHFDSHDAQDIRGCPPNERSGWETVRATVYEGFSNGVIVLEQETISSDLESYEQELRWFGERNALLLLVRAETKSKRSPRSPLRWLDSRGIGWRQIAAQVLLITAVTALMVTLLVNDPSL